MLLDMGDVLQPNPWDLCLLGRGSADCAVVSLSLCFPTLFLEND